MAKGEPASPPPRPKGAAHPSPLATHWPKEAFPHWPPLANLPPKGLPLATYGHRLPHWPPTGPLLAIRGGLPLAKGEAPTGQRDGRGSLWPHGSSSPPLPGHLWPKGSRTPHWPPTGHKGAAIGGRPSHLPSLAIREAPTGHKGTGGGRLRPALPPTGHLRTHSPHRPIVAFGREASPLPPTGPPLA